MPTLKSKWKKCTTATSAWLYYQGDFYSSEEDFILEWLDHWFNDELPDFLEFIGKKGDCRYSINTGKPGSVELPHPVHLDDFPSFLHGTKPYYLNISSVEDIVEKMVDSYVDALESSTIPSIYAEDLYEDFLERVYEDSEEDVDYGQLLESAVGLNELQQALDRFCFINASTLSELASDENCYSHIYTVALDSVKGKADLQYALDTCALLNSNDTWAAVVDKRVMFPISEDTWLKYIIYHLKDL